MMPKICLCLTTMSIYFTSLQLTTIWYCSCALSDLIGTITSYISLGASEVTKGELGSNIIDELFVKLSAEIMYLYIKKLITTLVVSLTREVDVFILY